MLKESEATLFDGLNIIGNDIELKTCRSGRRNLIETIEDKVVSELTGLVDLCERGMPLIQPYNGEVPEKIFGIHQSKDFCWNPNYGFHFYIYDFNFRRYLIRYKDMVGELKRLGVVIGPDFSAYKDYQRYRALYQITKSRLLTAYWQKCGVRVIPNCNWTCYRDIAECIEGLPVGSILAINSTGVAANKKCHKDWLMSYSYAVEKLDPPKILRYGGMIEGEDVSRSVYYDNHNKIAIERNGRK